MQKCEKILGEMERQKTKPCLWTPPRWSSIYVCNSVNKITRRVHGHHLLTDCRGHVYIYMQFKKTYYDIIWHGVVKLYLQQFIENVSTYWPFLTICQQIVSTCSHFFSYLLGYFICIPLAICSCLSYFNDFCQVISIE